MENLVDMGKVKHIFIFFLLITAFKPNAKAIDFAPVYSNFSSFTVIDTTSQLEDKKFNIYVSQGYLNIKYNKPQELLNGEVIIYNLLGQEVTRKKLETIYINQVSLSVQNTCYLIRISYSGKIHTQKVIVRSTY
jgi:hypothetical protein